MKTLTYSDDSYNFEWVISYNVNAMTLFDAFVPLRIQEVININIILPLSKVSFEKQAGGEFKYKLVFKDGRKWAQDITFTDVNDPIMTFNTNDLFQLSEFVLQRKLRDVLCDMHRQFDIESLVCTYD